jgi:hypothetical protein
MINHWISTGFAIVYPEFLSCRTHPDPALCPVPLTYWIMSVTPVLCIAKSHYINHYGLGFWTLFFACLWCLHLLEADRWQKDVRVGLHRGLPKQQQQLWSIHPWNSLEIPCDSADWWMKLRQNENWSYFGPCNNWFRHHTTHVSRNWVAVPKKSAALIPSPYQKPSFKT